MRVVIVGFGSVGRSLTELLVERGLLGKTVKLVALLDSKGAAVKKDGFTTSEIMQLLKVERGCLSSSVYGKVEWKLSDVLDEVEAEVLVELTPSNYINGEPGLSHLHEALKRGLHVVTANKAPLVLKGDELLESFRKRGLSILYRATVMGGTPLIPLIKAIKHSIVEVEGILNASTNYLISRFEQGVPFYKAVDEAKRLGVLEADPRVDLEGVDAAAKLCIIALTIGYKIPLTKVKREPLTDDVAYRALSAIRKRTRLKYIANLKIEDYVNASVELKEIPSSDPLASVSGTYNGVKIRTYENSIFIKGIGGGGRPTAEAVLEDLLSLRKVFKGIDVGNYR